MRLFDTWTAGLPSELGQVYSDIQPIIADNIQTAIDDNPSHSFFNNLGDFLLAPPFNMMAIQMYSHTNKLERLVIVEASEPDSMARIAPVHIPDGAKWALSFDTHERHGENYLTVPMKAFCFVDEAGVVLEEKDMMNTIILPQHRPLIRHLDKMIVAKAAINAAMAAGFVITLMNCGNVELVDHAATPHRTRNPKKLRRLRTEPSHAHKRLYIRRGKAADRELQEIMPRSTQTARRQYIRRGHIKHYSEDAPLFGRWSGAWYWEPRLMGNKSQGQISKDYIVDLEED